MKEQLPYQSLGKQLKRMRERAQESLAEVSGAVEIDVTVLTEIERGAQRPTEDILMLLLSHFSVKDEEAVKLWELAGYSRRETLGGAAEHHSDTPQQVLVMPMDARVVYTDMFHIMVNKYGVVMNFMQGAGPGNRPLAVSRIGMSHEHAREVMEALQKSLTPEQPKFLPAPKPDNDAASGVA